MHKKLICFFPYNTDRMAYQLKQVKGVPYYINDNRAYTFELQDGQPSPDCCPIGTYVNDTIQFDEGWQERLQPRLDAFRSSVVVINRESMRETVAKPQKPHKPSAATSKKV
jgi:hypothetical protein